jgi:DNA topoisomerase-1
VSALARSDAAAAGLRYVSPDSPGISRRGVPGRFQYRDAEGKAVRDRADLERIRAIAIPPAWTDVWICPDPRGHIQAIGRDARGRRQYRYHARFRARRDREKFDRLIRFGKALPRIRRRVRADVAKRGLPREKVVAAVVSLLETTRFRVGNAEYARLNRSFGISTLRRRHATVSGGSIRFRFRGKGGRVEERTLVDRRLAAVVRRCQELPGQSLFQYVDDEGEERAISSEDVNDYLRDAAGSDEFSAKDFRTWVATVLAHRALRGAARAPEGPPRDPVRAAIRVTAAQINDTVAVTRSSYVHPAVLESFEAEAESEPAERASRPARGAVERPARGPRAGTPRRSQPAHDETEAAAPITRREELEVLAILRAATRSATRPQVGRARAATRARGAAA